ncbi:hypothetical protein CLCR_02012 [Cladophialophora carrionii]|uniref:Domain of unknown function at the cortex 1 domain-containing protein n=1 Tax=Cladophialophora carrionii TaxID=86049 RepID=A0A1C1CDK7_9EURO|nr:hypothetical protein CLCR_02012 [Cladophialophora carrionii]
MADQSNPSNPSNASHYSQYRLRVTAGPSYNPSTHKTVPVNASKTLTFETPSIILSLCVRIRHFTGFPSDSPVTAEKYFTSDPHKYDQYSISFSFIPKTDIPGEDLVFGNDFDRPLRDRLPPGANHALRIVKWWIDPGLDGDMYADKPYLYGPALSSWNILRIGDHIIPKDQLQTPSGEENSNDDKHEWKAPHASAEEFHDTIVEEGCEGSGCELRSSLSIPADSTARKKHFLTASNLSGFTFEAGRLYQADFGNPYLDFNDFSLKLPGFSLNVVGYIDSKTHELRYTLKNRRTGEVYAVVVFTLLFGEELAQAEREHGGANVEDKADEHSAANTEHATAKDGPGTIDSAKDKKDATETIPEDEDDID